MNTAILALILIFAAAIYLILTRPKAGVDAELLRQLVKDAAASTLLDVSRAGSVELEEKRKAISQELEDKTKAIQKSLDTSRDLVDRSINNAESSITKSMCMTEEIIQAAVNQNKDSILKAAGDVEGAVQLLREVTSATSAGIKSHAAVTSSLAETVGALKETLKSTRARGAWGERMAEDVLRLAGMQEHVNYEKQATGASGSRPDFQIKMPHGLVVNMDVKFPFDNYMKFIETGDAAAMDQFIKDVKGKLKQVTGKDYIDPAAGTVDYAIMFMPNESAYAHVMEYCPAIMDEALAGKAVLASPMTLFAMLATIRQAMDSFKMAEGLKGTLAAIAEFKKQWEKHEEAVADMDKAVESLNKGWRAYSGTRSNMLVKAAEKVVL